jgi:hypothetical protein
VFVVWTIPSPWPKSCRRRPSSLYTFLSRGLARDWRWLLPLAFPDFERFYSRRFRWGTPILKSAASTGSATSASRAIFHRHMVQHSTTSFNATTHANKRSSRCFAWPRTVHGRLVDREWVFILTPSSLLSASNNETSRRRASPQGSVNLGSPRGLAWLGLAWAPHALTLAPAMAAPRSSSSPAIGAQMVGWALTPRPHGSAVETQARCPTGSRSRYPATPR